MLGSWDFQLNATSVDITKFGVYLIFLNFKKCPLFIYSTIIPHVVKNLINTITLDTTMFERC